MGSQTSGVGHGDRGLQLERTRLAWRRTTLATTVVALLAVGRVVVQGVRPAAIAGIALVAVAWLVVLAAAHRRIATLTDLSRSEGWLRSPHPDPVRPDHFAPRHAPAALALLTAALALLGLLLLG
jgi:hypothetical protein